MIMRRSPPKISKNISQEWVCCCPYLANMTRELPKANDCAYPAAYKELLHVIKYVLDTENIELKIELTRNAKEPWKIVCFSDSDYARNPVSRKSISDFILYVLDVQSLGNQYCKRVYCFIV